MSRQGDLEAADSILRKIASQPSCYWLVERYVDVPFPGIGFNVETSQMIDLTAEEANYLDRIRGMG